ncbi:hypothetical protein PGTUg99_019217 [Puccinia graminis f. sp. tritici]|uniref:Uncharacterized protein n=2 Tax=Puccinia graminis f. sp. tritici TaxID=56615 RepID=A0A5B0QKP9_PUCGR|nr:hypothetical protein PGTUg99_019217 [Puccinia graminis f. sp. tritici]
MKSILIVAALTTFVSLFEGMSAAPGNLIGGGVYLPNDKLKSLQNSGGKTIPLNPKKPLPSYTTEFYGGSGMYSEMFN